MKKTVVLSSNNFFILETVTDISTSISGNYVTDTRTGNELPPLGIYIVSVGIMNLA